MMKKGIWIVLGLIICFAAYIIYSKEIKNNKKKSAVEEQPLQISKNSDAFNGAIKNVLTQYYLLHDGLVNWDSASAIQQVTHSLGQITQKIPFAELKADTLLINTAKTYANTIIAECIGMQNEPAIERQRRRFYTISESLYNLLRTVQYDRATIYYVKCPMAFNGVEEAYWLSNKPEVVNPYFGTKDSTYHSGMLHCGSVEDSVSFR